MSRKQINFDPNLFSMKKNKSLKNKKSKSQSGGGVNVMSNLRKKIIKELNKKSSREHRQERIQQQQQKQHEGGSNNNIKTLNSEFTESLNFLDNNLNQYDTQPTKKQETIAKKQSSLKKPVISSSINKHEGISLDLPSSLQEFDVPSPDSQTTITLNPANNRVVRSENYNKTKRQDPGYGCLKNGIKPTYKHRNVTIRNSNIKFDDELEQKVYINANEPVTNINRNIEDIQEPTPVKQKSNISFDFSENSENSENSEKYKSYTPPPSLPPTPPPIITPSPPVQPEKIIETISSKVGEKNTEKIIKPNVRFENKNRRNKTLKKILVGKHGSKVSVLINDNKTRKKIKKEKQSLKTVPIRHVKEFLKSKGLIEVGSSAPEDVLRSLYENAKLTGEIENRNGEVYVNNFLEDRVNNTDEMGDHK